MGTLGKNLGMMCVAVATAVAWPASPALTKDRDDDHGRDNDRRANVEVRRDQHDQGRYDRHQGQARGGISIQVGGTAPSWQRVYVPGHYEVRTEQMLVEPGHYEQQVQQVLVEEGRWEARYVPPVEQVLRDSQGRLYKVIIAPSRTERVWIEPRYATRIVQVWCPDRYETRTVSAWVPGYYVTQAAPIRPAFNIGGIFRW